MKRMRYNEYTLPAMRSFHTVFFIFLTVLIGVTVLHTPFFVHAQPAVYTWDNPLTQQDAVSLICAISNAIRRLALPLAVVAIIFIGFQIVAAGSSGNPGKLQQLKSVLAYVIIGAVIIVAATVIVSAVVRFVADIGGGSAPQCTFF